MEHLSTGMQGVMRKLMASIIQDRSRPSLVSMPPSGGSSEAWQGPHPFLRREPRGLWRRLFHWASNAESQSQMRSLLSSGSWQGAVTSLSLCFFSVNKEGEDRQLEGGKC